MSGTCFDDLRRCFNDVGPIYEHLPISPTAARREWSAGVPPVEQAASRRHRRIEVRPDAPEQGRFETPGVVSSCVRTSVDSAAAPGRRPLNRRDAGVPLVIPASAIMN